MAKSNDKVNAAMATIVETVIDAMRNGTAPWQRPWHNRGNAPTNLSTKREYTGGNALYLAILGSVMGSDYWLGFNQAKKMGGNVRKGQKGTPILRPMTFKREDSDGNESFYIGGFKLAYVWNLTQIDGIEAPVVETNDDMLDATRLDAFVVATGAEVTYGGDRACYIPSRDVINMPERTAFKSEGGFYGTLLHELTHWTGHKSRLDRTKLKNDESLGYAFEELVAELGAYRASQLLDCPNEAENHASYLENWLGALESDPSYLWKAASQAEKAAQYLVGLAGEEKAAA